jgi:activator of HSP90 ATPase
MPTLVKQSVNLPAGPTDLYAMYLDSAAHAAFTAGGPATIAPVVGTEWSAFDGRIWGRVLALTPSRRIVQSWRSFEWKEPELDAVLILTFTATSAGTCVDLVQVGVPDRLYDTLVNGWPVRYWQPWRAYLHDRPAPPG